MLTNNSRAAMAGLALLFTIGISTVCLGRVGSARIPEEDKLEKVILQKVNVLLKKLNLEIEEGNAVVDVSAPGEIGSDDVSVNITFKDKSCVNIEAIALILQGSSEALTTRHGVGGLKQFRFSAFAPNDVVEQRNVPIDAMIKFANNRTRTARYLALGERDDPIAVHDSVFYSGCAQKLCSPDPESACTPAQEPPRKH